MGRKKDDVITFKVDDQLLEAMSGIRNRSDFIRNAILAALDNTCPLCGGTGKLSPHQMRHWKKFAEHHPLRECQTCNAMVLECDLDAPPGQEHQSPPPEKTAASECGGRKQKAWV